MSQDYKDGPGLKVPPPFIYMLLFGVGMGVEQIMPTQILNDVIINYMGWMFIIISLIIISMTMSEFKKAKTPFDVRQGAASLVTGGIMKYSRNPGYLALTILYLGIGIIFNNMWVLGLVIPLLLIMNLKVIRREEQHLQEVFGDIYMEYKARVRRWL